VTALALVTPDNFDRAESDRRFAEVVDLGGFGRLAHRRAFPDIRAQVAPCSNRDTLQSAGVFDLDAGPVTVVMPAAGGRFMSLQVFDEDGYSHGVTYEAGERSFGRDEIGTRYALVAVRTLVVEADPADLAAAHALQDAIMLRQAASGCWEPPTWDSMSQSRVREALLSLAQTVPDTRGMYGERDHVGELRHLVGAAAGWGGNPETAAFYQTVTPHRNDGRVAHRLIVGDVPVDGFWSVSVYNAEGYFEPNHRNAYTVNSLSARPSADGSIAIHFGDSSIFNFFAIPPGWSYRVRLYRPRREVLTGDWTFPEARPVE